MMMEEKWTQIKIAKIKKLKAKEKLKEMALEKVRKQNQKTGRGKKMVEQMKTTIPMFTRRKKDIKNRKTKRTQGQNYPPFFPTFFLSLNSCNVRTNGRINVEFKTRRRESQQEIPTNRQTDRPLDEPTKQGIVSRRKQQKNQAFGAVTRKPPINAYGD